MPIPLLQPGDRYNANILFNHFVYFNLHNRKWSLKALRLGPRGTGRVSGHARTVHLMGVTPKVSEAGRIRVTVEKRKNVHAGLVGKVVEVVHIDEFVITSKTPIIRYNPYQGPHFVDRDGRAFNPDDPHWEDIEHVVLHDGRAYCADALYYAEGTEGPAFLCREDVDDWAADTGYSGWVRRDCRRDLHYIDGRYCKNISAICAG